MSHALPKSASASPADRRGLRLGTRSPGACHRRARAEWTRSSRGNFFENLLGLRIALGMLRPDRKPHIAQSLELFADRAFVQLYAEHFFDAPLRSGAPPTHHAVFFSIRAFLEESGEFGFLLRGQPARPARRLAVFKPRQAFRIIAMHPVAQRLAVHPAGFGRSPAVFAIKHQGDRQPPLRRAPSPTPPATLPPSNPSAQSRLPPSPPPLRRWQ